MSTEKSEKSGKLREFWIHPDQFYQSSPHQAYSKAFLKCYEDAEFYKGCVLFREVLPITKTDEELAEEYVKAHPFTLAGFCKEEVDFINDVYKQAFLAGIEAERNRAK